MSVILAWCLFCTISCQIYFPYFDVYSTHLQRSSRKDPRHVASGSTMCSKRPSVSVHQHTQGSVDVVLGLYNGCWGRAGQIGRGCPESDVANSLNQNCTDRIQHLNRENVFLKICWGLLTHTCFTEQGKQWSLEMACCELNDKLNFNYSGNIPEKQGQYHGYVGMGPWGWVWVCVFLYGGGGVGGGVPHMCVGTVGQCWFG